MTPKEKFQSLRHLILETPLDKRNICELEKKCDLYADDIEQALTPPTQEEVCETLSELTRMSVYYSNGKFRLHGDVYGEIIDLNDLPPHLITLIGRFYEGLGK